MLHTLRKLLPPVGFKSFPSSQNSPHIPCTPSVLLPLALSNHCTTDQFLIHKINWIISYVLYCVWLSSLIRMNVRFIRVIISIDSLFLLSNSILLYGCTMYLSIHLLIYIRLGQFQVFSLRNKNAINVWVQVFVRMLVLISFIRVKECNGRTNKEFYKVLPSPFPLALRGSCSCFVSSPTLSNVCYFILFF